jgi:cytochrome c-type biogenesis protein CcmH/NrfG
LAAFQHRPLLGYGPDSFSVAYPSNRDDRDAQVLYRQPQSSAHSWVLQALATTGLVGLGALLAAMIAGGWMLWRNGTAAVAAPLLIGFAAYWADGLVAVGTVGVDWFPWLALGAAASLAGKRLTRVDPVRKVPRIVSIAIVLAACVGALSGLIALSAGEEAWQARILALRHSTLSIGHASQAVALDSGRAEYWSWLGIARELTSDWKSASEAHLEAARRQPYNARFWANLARTLTRQALENDFSNGGASAAIAAAQRGVDEDPNNPDANAALAETGLQLGRGDMALAGAVRAIVLYPIDPAYDLLALRLARRASDLRSAAAQLDRALGAKDSAPLRVAAAEIALRLGDNAAAKAHATRAAQLAPDDPDVKRLLTQIPAS